jgi:hypothetical protein
LHPQLNEEARPAALGAEEEASAVS